MFKKILIFVTVACFMLTCVTAANAATLELQPGTGTANVNDTISLDLVLNVGQNENVWGYEAYISYPTDLLTYNSSQFVAGAVFATGGKTVHSSSADKVTVGGYFDSSSAGTATGGVVATLNFSAKAAGSAVVAIICDQFTNVYAVSSSSANLFTNCAVLAPKSTYTIAGAGAATATATPTESAGATSTSTPTPTPTSSSSSTSVTSTPTPTGTVSQLPETGSLDGAKWLIYIGGGMLFLGSLLFFGFTRIASRKLR